MDDRLIDRFAIRGDGIKGRCTGLDLDQATLVVGESGSGKTRLLGALGLGLRDKQKGPPSPGAPADGETIIEITGPTLSISRTVGSKRALHVTHGQKVAKTIPTGQKLIDKVVGRAAGELRDVAGFLDLSADKQRAVYLEVSGVSQDLDRKNISSRLNHSIPVFDPREPSENGGTEPSPAERGLMEAHSLASEISNDLGDDTTGMVDWTTMARTKLAAERKETAARLTQAVRTVETMPALGPDRLPSGRLEGAKARLAEREAAVSAVEREQQSVSERSVRRQQLTDDLLQREAEVARLAERAAAVPVMDEVYVSPSSLQGRIDELQQDMQQHVASRTRAEADVGHLRQEVQDLQDGKCPKCGASGEHVQHLLEAMRGKLRMAQTGVQFAQEDFQETGAEIEQLQYDLAKARNREQWLAEHKAVHQQMERAQVEVARVKKQLDALPEQDATDIDQRLAEAQAAHTKAQAECDAFVERAAQEKMDGRAKAMLDQSKAYLKHVKALEKEVQAIEQEVLEAAAEVITARANEIVRPVCGEGWSYYYDVDRALTGLVNPACGDVHYDNLSHGEQALWAVANLWAMVSQEPWPALVADRLEVMRTDWLTGLLGTAAELMAEGRLHACLLGARYPDDQAEVLVDQFRDSDARVVHLREEG